MAVSWIGTLVFLMLANTAFTQETIGVKYKSKVITKSLSLSPIAKQSTKHTAPPPSIYPSFSNAKLIPAFKPKHFGYFCKLENQIETKSKVPLRFRLGSLDYVNYLEQKYNPTVDNISYP